MQPLRRQAAIVGEAAMALRGEEAHMEPTALCQVEEAAMLKAAVADTRQGRMAEEDTARHREEATVAAA